MSLDLTKLDNVKTNGEKTTAACPACRAAGSDKTGNHLLINADGSFGCATHKDDPQHRKEIHAAVGVKDATPTKSGGFGWDDPIYVGKTSTPTRRGWPSAEKAASNCEPQDYKLQAVFLYPKSGKPFAAVARYEDGIGKTFRQFHFNGDSWAVNGPAGKWPLYGLDALPPDGRVFIVEGEKAAAAAVSIGMVVVTSAGGASADSKSDWQPLAGREVVILPDNDKPGERYARNVAGILANLNTPAHVRIVRLPGLPEGGDIMEWIEEHDATEPASMCAGIEALVIATPFWTASSEAPANDAEGGMPRIISAATFTASPIPEPEQVVCGVLHRGSKLVYGGPSKAYKSWSLIDLCLAVSTGGKWLNFDTTQGLALYINLELQDFALHHRLNAIAHDRGCGIPPALRLWNLRGFSRPLSELLPDLLSQIAEDRYSLIVIDPIYKTLSGRNENDAGDIGVVCNEIEAVAVKTGAAVAFGAHFAKGNASSKEHLDRVSGSGVWARDPDAIITASPHEQDGAFTVDTTLRNFQPCEQFVIGWQYPRMRCDDTLDPARLRQPKNGRTAEHTVADILEHLTEPIRAGQWQKACLEEAGISEKTFYRKVKEAKGSGRIKKEGALWVKQTVSGNLVDIVSGERIET